MYIERKKDVPLYWVDDENPELMYRELNGKLHKGKIMNNTFEIIEEIFADIPDADEICHDINEKIIDNYITLLDNYELLLCYANEEHTKSISILIDALAETRKEIEKSHNTKNWLEKENYIKKIITSKLK